MKGIKAVTVFCSASDVDEKYLNPAVEVAGLIGKEGWTFVWGGSDTGMMREMSSEAQNKGARLVGISVEHLAHKAKDTAEEMIIASTLAERRELLVDRGQAILVMPGGIGTLDEVFEVLEKKKHSQLNKEVIFANFSGFFDGLRTQLLHMNSEGFLPKPLSELAYFATNPLEIVSLLKE